ncbi:L-aspartate oxidase [Sciscionella sp. SE31]|uniref:L-aspartate oxidase n=1 Tax=Sciscionella sediminilitoris TaxID=1445613 RepID=UPI0004DECBEC
MSIGWEAAADLVVVGSGVAGLTAALHAHERGLRVLVVSKDEVAEGSTRFAQGGIAVVFPQDAAASGDDIEAHLADTMAAGAGLCERAAAAAILADGPVAVQGIRDRGAVFDQDDDGSLARTREGGHGAFRVVHAGGDATGAEVQRALVAAASGTVPVLTGHVAVDAVRTSTGAVGGLLVLDESGLAGLLRAPAVLLATGGLGQLYTATTNPAVATGDGIALALRASALVADLEFVQFHPTVLYTGAHVTGQRPLVTEAVRGEGAVLVDECGRRIMTGVHELADLAPRDVVSAAIARSMAETGAEHVYLDASAVARGGFAARFPTVHAACAQAGIDPARDPIPVAPAAHFSCGGVVASVDGRTTVPGLYAIGEVARTGLHGANRLASNSVLEGLVTGGRVAEAVRADLGEAPETGRLEEPSLPAEPMAPARRLRPVLSRRLGIGRDAEGMRTAIEELTAMATVRPLWTREGVERAAMTLTAKALAFSALHREESRGAHVRVDFPERDDARFGHSAFVCLDVSGRPLVIGKERARLAA